MNMELRARVAATHLKRMMETIEILVLDDPTGALAVAESCMADHQDLILILKKKDAYHLHMQGLIETQLDVDYKKD